MGSSKISHNYFYYLSRAYWEWVTCKFVLSHLNLISTL